MALTRPFPVDAAFPLGLDLRRELAALVPFEGVFADPVTIDPAGIAYANGGWNVGARPFSGATRRGTAAFTQNYGTALLTNDASGTAWTIPSAPVSGSRIDILWVRATDPSQGEAATGNDGPGGVARAVPIFGQSNGIAATTPSAPALPAGAVEVARITTPSGAASITGSTFAHTYRFTALAGTPIPIRGQADLATLPALQGLAAQVIGVGGPRWRYDGTAWNLDNVPEYASNALRDATLGGIPTPLAGDRIFRSDKGYEQVYTGTAWRADAVGLVPVIPTAVAGTGVTVGAGGAVTFTASTTVSVTAFNADFDNYLIVFDSTTASASSQLFGRLRAGATDDNAANYNHEFLYASGAGTATAGQNKGSTAWQLAAGGAAIGHALELKLYGPQQARVTKGWAQSVDYDTADTIVASNLALGNKVSTAFDGITIYPNTGTITGKLRVYGYNNN